MCLHLKVASSTVYRRAFPFKSSALTVHERAWPKYKRAWSKIFRRQGTGGVPSGVLALGPAPSLDGPDCSNVP